MSVGLPRVAARKHRTSSPSNNSITSTTSTSTSSQLAAALAGSGTGFKFDFDQLMGLILRSDKARVAYLKERDEDLQTLHEQILYVLG